MKIQSCILNANLNVNLNFVKIKEILDGMSEFKKPIQFLNYPDDVPLEVPRIIAVTNHNHSQLIVTGNNIQITTNFDDNFNGKLEECFNYLENNNNIIINILNNVSIKDMYYYGISINCIFDNEDKIVRPISYIKDKFIKYNTNCVEDEVSLRSAFVLENKYYCNILLQNQRYFDGPPSKNGSFAGRKYMDVLLTSIDINDRYAFNNFVDYKSSIDETKNIFSILKLIVNNQIPVVVKEGKFVYDK